MVKLLFTTGLLFAVLLLGGAFLATSNDAQVSHTVSLSHDDIARAKAILRRNDPRELPAGARRTIEIEAKDLNLAANYLLRSVVDGSARLTPDRDRLGLLASVRIPRLPWRNVVNISGIVRPHDGQPRIDGLTLGELPVPDAATNWLLGRLFLHIADASGYHADHQPVRDFAVEPGRVRLTYQWQPGLIEQARSTLLSGGDRDALRYYHDEIVVLQARGIGRKGRLVHLLGALFTSAQARSRTRDPMLENTALLTVLGTWASRRNLTRLVPGDMARPTAFRLKIHRRIDFAQHFLTSAALAARSDSAFADAVGLFKEMNDGDHGSGFSFTDIAADRTGTRFGALATRSEEDARRIQRHLAAGVGEDEIMPAIGDLPEHMRSAVFKERFSHVGSPAYHAVMQDIERRIGNSALYRE